MAFAPGNIPSQSGRYSTAQASSILAQLANGWGGIITPGPIASYLAAVDKGYFPLSPEGFISFDYYWTNTAALKALGDQGNTDARELYRWLLAANVVYRDQVNARSSGAKTLDGQPLTPGTWEPPRAATWAARQAALIDAKVSLIPDVWAPRPASTAVPVPAAAAAPPVAQVQIIITHDNEPGDGINFLALAWRRIQVDARTHAIVQADPWQRWGGFIRYQGGSSVAMVFISDINRNDQREVDYFDLPQLLRTISEPEEPANAPPGFGTNPTTVGATIPSGQSGSATVDSSGTRQRFTDIAVPPPDPTTQQPAIDPLRPPGSASDNPGPTVADPTKIPPAAIQPPSAVGGAPAAVPAADPGAAAPGGSLAAAGASPGAVVAVLLIVALAAMAARRGGS